MTIEFDSMHIFKIPWRANILTVHEMYLIL